MNKRLLGAALAAGLAVIGTFAILLYVRDADDRAQADLELVDVYVIEDHVAAGSDEVALRRAIGVDQIRRASVVDGVVTDLTELDGLVAAVDLVPGEQVLRSRLIDQASFNEGRTQLTSVPDGLHEVTVALEPERVVGGHVIPGNRIGVIATFNEGEIKGIAADNYDSLEELEQAILDYQERYSGEDTPINVPYVSTTHFVLNRVLVTRVQVEELPREVTDDEGNVIDSGVIAPTGNLLVTVALEAEDVQKLIFSKEFGSIWMTYEPDSTEDHTDDLDPTHRANVFGHPHGEGDDPADVLIDDEAAEPEAETDAEEEAAS